MPKISILTPCFNHEKYILQFLESVKNQTFKDFELIIINDCSTDNTANLIKNFNDDRIKLINQEFNQGLNSALNIGFENSSSDILVYIASDDILNNNALELIVKAFEENPDKNVVYSAVSAIDETGKSLNSIIKPKLKNRFEILRKIFYSSNPLISPGMAIKKSAFEKIYPLQPAIVNLQDVLMHINLLLENEILVTDNILINYRIPCEKSGISVRSTATENRENLEVYSILNEFLKIKDVDLLYKIFGEDVKKYGQPTVETIPYFLAQFALNSDKQTRKVWGYHTLVNFLASQENFDLINKLYGFDYKQLLNLVKAFDETEEMKLNKKVKKYKNLFNITLLISSFVVLFMIILMFIVK